MSNRSRIACSLAPAYFHHWRSKARISRSRRLRPSASGWAELRASAASISPPRSGRWSTSEYPVNHTDVIHDIPGTPGDPSGRSRIEHAHAACVRDPAHPDHLGRGPHRHLALGRERGDLGVGALDQHLEPLVDLVLAPEVGLQVLYPLE